MGNFSKLQFSKIPVLIQEPTCFKYRCKSPADVKHFKKYKRPLVKTILPSKVIIFIHFFHGTVPLRGIANLQTIPCHDVAILQNMRGFVIFLALRKSNEIICNLEYLFYI
jgi:hypothetical protein